MPEWQIEDEELARTFSFEDFPAALAFVNRVGEQAEKAGPHPDIDIRYNRVCLGLLTHDAGGLTANDFALAAVVERLTGWLPGQFTGLRATLCRPDCARKS